MRRLPHGIARRTSLALARGFGDSDATLRSLRLLLWGMWNCTGFCSRKRYLPACRTVSLARLRLGCHVRPCEVQPAPASPRDKPENGQSQGPAYQRTAASPRDNCSAKVSTAVLGLACSVLPASRPARIRLAAMRFDIHSQVLRMVSSKSLMSKISRPSGAAKAPRLCTWASPQIWASISV